MEIIHTWEQRAKMSKFKIAAAVMVGGKSSRMGQPKENIIIPSMGITFLDKICGEIALCMDSKISGCYLSVRRGQSIERSGYVCVQDTVDEIGPMGGIYSVLLRAGKDGYDAVWFVACDMIRMEAEEIRNVCERYGGEDVLFARTGQSFIQPFGSIYKTDVAEVLKKKIDEKNYRIRSLMDEDILIGYFDSMNLEMYDNINEKSDLIKN
jgi:molybdopterin-guanine dinucleotide biosynthesis protein A